MKGKLIFLNGVTSTGKSSVADCIKEMSRDIFYTSSNDIFHGMVAWNHFEGKFWSLVAHTVSAQYHAVRGLIDGGFNVIIDGMFLDLNEYRELFGKSNFELFSDIFRDCEHLTVDLVCDPAELRRRNIVRRNRGEFQSDDQLSKMTRPLLLDMTIDVMKVMPDECAAMILEKAGFAYDPLPSSRLEKKRCRILGELLKNYDVKVSQAVPENAEFYSCSDIIENTVTVKSAGNIELVGNDLLGRGYLPYRKNCGDFSVLERSFMGKRTEIVRIKTADQREYTRLTDLLGKEVTVKIDRPLGSAHPHHPDLIYRVNYGYLPDTSAPDGDEADAYVLGIDEAVDQFTGYAAAVLHRFDDSEEKLIVLPDGISMNNDEILSAVNFVEQYFDTVAYLPKMP